MHFHVLTDASVCHNYDIVTTGYWILDKDWKSIDGPVVMRADCAARSDTAEMCAAVTALKRVRELAGDHSFTTHLYTDSHAVVFPELHTLSYLSSILQSQKRKCNVTVIKVKGHMAKHKIRSREQRLFA